MMGDLEGHEAVVQEYVKGKVVWDLGAGRLTLAEKLVALGASRVFAVEKEEGLLSPPWSHVTALWCCIDQAPFPQPDDVVFLSWPLNHVLGGLVERLEQAGTIIYLGMNDGVSACGGPDFWTHVVGRELLVERTTFRHERQEFRHDLVVYGKILDEPRAPKDLTPQEQFILASWIVQHPDLMMERMK